MSICFPWSGKHPDDHEHNIRSAIPTSFSNVVPNLSNVNQIVLFSTFSSMAFQVGNWNGSGLGVGDGKHIYRNL